MKKLLIVTFVAAMALSAQATVIIDWDGTTTDVVPNGTQNMSITKTFFTTSFTSPAVGADYYPNNTGKTPDFYAAIDSTERIGSYSIWQGGNAHLLNRFQNNNAAAAGTREFMAAWDVTSTEVLESFTLNGFGAFGLPAPNAEVRFLFQDTSGDWHASAGIAHAANNTPAVLADVTATSWYGYTPHIDGVVTIGAAPEVVDFSDVQRAGYYLKWDTDGTGGTYSTGFQVTAIPEPATIGLMGMALAGLAAFRRRRG